MKGKYIVLEGPEGSGKNTQLELLKEYLTTKLKRKVKITREPGGNSRWKLIREALLDQEYEQMCGKISPSAELLLFMANRADFTDKIKKDLKNNLILLSNRNYFSSYAYQGYGRDIPLEDIDWLVNFSMKDLKPDLTFIIMVDPKIGLAKCTTEYEKGDRIAEENIEFHQRVYNGYLNLKEKFPELIYIEYMEGKKRRMHEQIRKKVQEIL